MVSDSVPVRVKSGSDKTSSIRTGVVKRQRLVVEDLLTGARIGSTMERRDHGMFKRVL